MDVTDIKKERDKIYLNTTVFDTVRDGIFSTDKNGVIIKANKSFIKITG